MGMIIEARVLRYELPFRLPTRAGGGVHESRSGLLLGLLDEDGRIGWGEAAPLPGWSRDDFAHVEAGLLGLSESIRQRPRQVEALYPTAAAWLRRLPSAAAALDGALMDLAAQRRGESLADYLSGSGDVRESVGVNALVVGETVDLAADGAARARDDGFDCFKVKVGGNSIDEDVARVGAVREVVGDRAALRVDAESSWDLDTAARALNALEPFQIEYAEDPVDDLDQLVQLAVATGVPLAVDGLLAHSDDPLGVVSAAVADVFVLKPGALGGLTITRTIALAAGHQGKKAVVTSFLDSAVGLAGAVALAASLPGDDVASGLATSYLFAENVAEPPTITAGRIRVPSAPGLGLAPTVDGSGSEDMDNRKETS